MRDVLSTLAELVGVGVAAAGVALEVGGGWALMLVGAYLVVAGVMQGSR